MSNTTDLIARLHARRMLITHSDGRYSVSGTPDPDCDEAADALTALTATIAEQVAQIEALRADAERWRYVRGGFAAQSLNIDGMHHWTWRGYHMLGRGASITQAIDAAMQSGKAAEPDATKCRKCNGNMRPGTYLEQTFSGTPDFPGDTHAVTVSPSGPGRLAECLKCDACGHSVTAGKAVTP